MPPGYGPCGPGHSREAGWWIISCGNPAVKIIQGKDAAISQARTRGCRYIIITAGQDETEDAARYHSPGREDAAVSQARTRLRMPLYHHHRPGKAGCYTHSDRPGRLVMLYHRPCRENVLYHRPGMTKSQAQTSSTGLRHPSFNGKEGAGKRCSE